MGEIGMVAMDSAGTRHVCKKADQNRMLKAVLLALCIDTVLMLAFALVPEIPFSPGVESASSTLLVKLGTPSRAPAVSNGAANARAEQPVPLSAAPHDPSPHAEYVFAESMPIAPQADIAETTAAMANARAAAHPNAQSDDPPQDSVADGSASAGWHADTAGLSEAIASGSPGTASRAELVRHIDALVRERLVYPPLARRRNIEGVVKLTLFIDMQGRLGGSSPVCGSGSPILDRAAKALVEEIFPIYLAGGLEEPVYISIMISYSLTS